VTSKSADLAGVIMPVVSEDHRNSRANTKGSQQSPSDDARISELKAFAARLIMMAIVVGYAGVCVVCFGLDSWTAATTAGQLAFQV
jgi:hypothetical protein